MDMDDFIQRQGPAYLAHLLGRLHDELVRGAEQWYPDMGVTVSFLEKAPEQGAEPRRGVRVPAAAVVQRDGVDAGFVVAGETAELRKVEAGGKLGDDREVLSGLGPGETVVVDPPAELAHGATVTTATK